MKIYLAKPMTGISCKSVFDYYTKTKSILNHTYEIYCPLACKGFLMNDDVFEKEYTESITSNHGIFERDKWMVSQSDIVFCDFSETTSISLGCVSEIMIANTLNKYIIVVMNKMNVHNHPFVKEAASIIFETHDEAISYLIKLGRMEF